MNPTNEDKQLTKERKQAKERKHIRKIDYNLNLLVGELGEFEQYQESILDRIESELDKLKG